MRRTALLIAMLFVACVAANPGNATVVVDQIQYTDCGGVDGFTKDGSSNVIDCSWGYRIDDAVCNETTPCDKLVIVFSGGTMACDERSLNNDTRGLGKHLDQYTQAGYLATAACTGESQLTSDNISPYEESARVEKLIHEIIAEFAEEWIGDYLLISGESHGASSVGLSFLRTDIDDTLSDATTGVCLYDGGYDALDNETAMQGDMPDCEQQHQRRFCNAYKGEESVPGQLYCDLTNDDGEGGSDCPTYNANFGPPFVCMRMRVNSVTNAFARSWTPDAFWHDNFKIVSCAPFLGGVCLENGVPADGPVRGPQEGLCDVIDADGDKTCEFEHHGGVGHAACVTDEETIASCKDWFEELIDP